MTNISRTLWGTALLPLLLAACNASDKTASSIQEIYVSHYKQECMGMMLGLCLLTREQDDAPWGLFYDPIRGFEYEWGHTYKLRVRVEEVENPPEDGSSAKYSLIEVMEKEPVATEETFDISVNRSVGGIEQIAEGRYRFYSEKEFVCHSTDCATVESLLTQDMGILFEFRHAADPSQPLHLLRVLCSASRESFWRDCIAQ